MVIKKKTKKKALTKRVVVKPIEKKIETRKTKPFGVKVIATYYIIVAAINILLGLIMCVFSKKASNIIISRGASIPDITLFSPKLVVIIGLVLILFGLIGLLLGRGLWNLKKWARMAIMILALIAFFGSLINIIAQFELSAIVGIVIYGFIAGYLIFSKEVKAVFK